MQKVKINIAEIEIDAEFNDSASAKRVLEALPLEGHVHTWGGEINFTISLPIDFEGDAKEVVEVGDIGYWPDGPAICLFFGPTPLSGEDGKPTSYSPVNVIGRIKSNLSELFKVQTGNLISIDKL